MEILFHAQLKIIKYKINDADYEYMTGTKSKYWKILSNR